MSEDVQARVEGFALTERGTFAVRVACGNCEQRFLLHVPVPADDHQAASSFWIGGTCPHCFRTHRARATVVINLQDERMAAFTERMRR